MPIKNYLDTPKCTPADIEKIAGFFYLNFGKDRAFEFYNNLIGESWHYGEKHYMKMLTKGEVFMTAYYTLVVDVLEDVLSDAQLFCLQAFLIELCGDEIVQTDCAPYESDKLGNILINTWDFNYFENDLPLADVRQAFLKYQRLGLLPEGAVFDEAYYAD